jgi:hypothetical protein
MVARFDVGQRDTGRRDADRRDMDRIVPEEKKQLLEANWVDAT